MSKDWVRPRRARVLAGLLLLGVFAAGALTGAAANRLVQARDAEPIGERRIWIRSAPGGQPGARVRFGRSPARLLQQRLNLTPEQAAEVEQIFEARRQTTERLVREIEPGLQAQRDSTDVEIRAVLTGTQVEAFDRMIEQRRRMIGDAVYRIGVPRRSADPGGNPSGPTGRSGRPGSQPAGTP